MDSLHRLSELKISIPVTMTSTCKKPSTNSFQGQRQAKPSHAGTGDHETIAPKMPTFNICDPSFLPPRSSNASELILCLRSLEICKIRQVFFLRDEWFV